MVHVSKKVVLVSHYPQGVSLGVKFFALRWRDDSRRVTNGEVKLKFQGTHTGNDRSQERGKTLH